MRLVGIAVVCYGQGGFLLLVQKWFPWAVLVGFLLHHQVQEVGVGTSYALVDGLGQMAHHKTYKDPWPFVIHFFCGEGTTWLAK